VKVLTAQEAREWCSSVGAKSGKDGLLGYKGPNQHKFFVEAPEAFREIVVLIRQILTFRGEPGFDGGMLWLRQWEIGSPQLVRAGWKIIEGMRRAQGELRPLEVAPAQVFRGDELVDLHGFLVQVVGFGWVVDLVRPTGDFFLHFKSNRQICFAANSAGTLAELRANFNEWNPTDEDPMVLKMRAIEKARRVERRKSKADC
jgi:hypothetical protein